MQTERLTNVHQIEDIFLKTRATKTDTRVEKTIANTSVHANGACNLRHRCARLFTQRRDTVNRRHALRQKRIRHQFGEFRAPQIRGQNTLRWHPMLIDPHQLLHRRYLHFAVLVATNQHSVRFGQIANSSAFSEEFRIGQHCKLETSIVGMQHTQHGVRSTNRQRRFLNHNLVAVGHFCYMSRCQFPIFQIRGFTGTAAVFFGWCVHRHKYH
mmetsp:Transcript_14919/g.22528  ORF Transcript_14919/g.22528 Transcript_14919/m.22528 type:complete len:212 (+) Transcript_14919:120-755(+)